ncbi:LysM peptidoglycan-binding domain-containing protein [Thermoflexibacter ruber]|uniref:LysM domain-containing protein n=1 Tax=Thermoflexibacter ruber TaxID=1003 RepID=A0A1I2KE44_9BACT|nr:LysM peptidoglycan-binding domain-containing protein [Thermoflexibacter ruber]SFF65322.1 LysM domain-containing protein [Thermoflexibacter ruber]
MAKKLFFNILAFLFCFTSHSKAFDSLGIVKKEDKFFIIHKVSPRETLIGLAKRYQVKVEELRKHNEALAKKDQINVGQVLYIPTKEVPAPPKANLTEKNAQKKNNRKPKYHIVKENESLYKIAFMHNVHIDSVKKWNQLADNQIKINDRLMVGYAFASTTEEPAIPKSGANIVQESGMGAMISGTKTDLKLALHRKLPVGSYVRVFNESSGTSVTVKIIGKIPNIDADQKVIIKLSQSACKSLGVVNERFPVTLSYEKVK